MHLLFLSIKETEIFGNPLLQAPRGFSPRTRVMVLQGPGITTGGWEDSRKKRSVSTESS